MHSFLCNIKTGGGKAVLSIVIMNSCYSKWPNARCQKAKEVFKSGKENIQRVGKSSLEYCAFF